MTPLTVSGKHHKRKNIPFINISDKGFSLCHLKLGSNYVFVGFFQSNLQTVASVRKNNIMLVYWRTDNGSRLGSCWLTDANTHADHHLLWAYFVFQIDVLLCAQEDSWNEPQKQAEDKRKVVKRWCKLCINAAGCMLSGHAERGCVCR